MVVFFTAFHRTSCIFRYYPVRTFHLSPSCRVTEPIASSRVSSAKKTVKAFVDMPTAYLRPDGTAAPPLEEWWACESDYDSSPRFNKKNNAGNIPHKSRVRKTPQPPNDISDSAAYDNTSITYDESSSILRPKRGRKRKVKVEEPQPPNNEASAQRVTKRGRKAELHLPPKSGMDYFAPQNEIILNSMNSPIPELRYSTVSGKGASEVVDENERPRNTLAKEILDNLDKFPHCLLLTKVGQFYESYFDQAIEISRLLNIKLTTRRWDGRRIPMCGFPLIHIDKYIKVLVQQNNRFVAMCEEFPRYSNTGAKEFDRRVVRVITPGTLIDEPFLNPYENNYLLAIGFPDHSESISTEENIGLAWIDVSTGEFYSKVSTYDNLRDELARISPREVVLDKQLESKRSHPIFQILAEDDKFFTFISLSSSRKAQEAQLSESIPSSANNTSHHSPGYISLSPNTLPETYSIDLLTRYLQANLLEHMPSLPSPHKEDNAPRMQIDSHTIKALEIRERIREGGVKGSLLSVIKRTLTTGGTRLLTRWLCSPSTSVVEINARQSLVAFFYTRPHFLTDIAEILANIEDTSRITQKFTLGRGDASDLLAINKTIQTWSMIIHRISEEKKLEALERSKFSSDEWNSPDALMSRITDLHELSNRISMALADGLSTKDDPLKVEGNVDGLDGVSVGDDDSNVILRRGPNKWAIKQEFSPTLRALHKTLRDLIQEKNRLESSLQLQYDAPSLTLRASPIQGMHVHLSKAKRDQSKLNAAAEFVSIAESGSTRCYFLKEWSQLGGQITETTMALMAAEKEAFEMLRDEVTSHALALKRNAQILDELDVALSFATVATEMNFVRPVLTVEPIYEVTNGRHPTVELGLLAAGRVFTPNTVQMSPSSKLHVITGPNMAGKSTFLRQTALIAILAQTGSFVPADAAVIGVVDKVFSRIGAKDDLFHDRSTFMVEMLETAEILRRATPQSLVIMDEVGRGTTVKDGLAIAFATIHHLVLTNKCRSLFATHFHELSDMIGYPNNQVTEGIFNNVTFSCTDVDETDDNHFAYSYRVRPGVNRDSHGLKVAQLAGMPSSAMKVAKEALSWVKTHTKGDRIGGLFQEST